MSVGRRLAWGLVLGGVLGMLYAFLRPLGRKHPALADGLFLLGAAWAWLWQGFGVCGGDLRLGYYIGVPVGALVWYRAAGRLCCLYFPVSGNFFGPFCEFRLSPENFTGTHISFSRS